jgi:hypothetical protein
MQGFLVSLEHRGVFLRFQSSSFPALVEPLQSTDTDYAVSEFEREQSRIAVLRDNLPPGIKPGAFLEEAPPGDRRHRVTAIYDHPTDITVRLMAETSPAYAK